MAAMHQIHLFPTVVKKEEEEEEAEQWSGKETMPSEIEKTCRLCKVNLVVKGVITHSKLLYRCSQANERLLTERFRDVGVVLPCRPGVYSGRICMKCFRLLARVEESQNILKKWQSEHNVVDKEEEEGQSTEKRDRDTPTETPRKKKLCLPASRVSTTEVYINYPSKVNPERYRCDADISGVINNLAKGNFTTAARLMVQHESLIDALKPAMETVIDKECQRLCHQREGFMLWKSSPEELRNFSLHNLRKDLERIAPFMFSLICTISGMQHNHACAAAAIALRGRENHLSAFSYYINSVLQYGGAKKAVFEQLCKMGITTTHARAVLKQHAMSTLCGEELQNQRESCSTTTAQESIGQPTTPHLRDASLLS
ncbi:uncharacterized protein LOC117251077 [Epinephelus lanceolatus]|uniref:uncharacterized protein LOC117251077 n=1 Tax=Epinephelus lanceolatus TaxID=310571 RepID=UPI0014454E44|nr:uncharacterized protein LOC117251077 [Epinephelus lanceolatus]